MHPRPCRQLTLVSAGLILTLQACAFSIKVGQLPSTKTELEEQVIGTYREIDDELIMVSTVRGEAPPGLPELSLKLKYARQNQKFNLDDIEELKNAQILGEAADGSLAMVPASSSQPAPATADLQGLASILIGEENADRRVIWQEIISRQPNLGSDALGEVRKSYAALKVKESKLGQWYQTADGQWLRKTNANS